MNVKDKTALVTGAGGGIGRAIAISLAKRGCHLALLDIDVAGLEQTGNEAREEGVRVSEHVLDVCDREVVKALPDKIQKAHGGLDILVNNAGKAAAGSFLEVKEAHFDQVMEVNFHAVVRLTRAFLPHLLSRETARIVNISSLYGLISPAEQTAYSASKFAVRGFSNALRFELEGSHVGVTVVHPGGVATNIVDNAFIPKDFTEDQIRRRKRREKKLLRMPPEKAGEVIVKGILRDKARVLVGRDARLVALLERLFPVSYGRVLRVLMARAGSENHPPPSRK